MILIRYKSGWLRFKTIKDLLEVTGWNYDQVSFALKTNIGINGIMIKELSSISKPKSPDKAPALAVNLPEMRHSLKVAKIRCKRSKRIIDRYEKSWFTGRIETNEIKQARIDKREAETTISRLKREISNVMRYRRSELRKSPKSITLPLYEKQTNQCANRSQQAS